MLSFFKKLFGKTEKLPEPTFTQEESEKDYELKSEGLENVLGKMHGIVRHAIIPFAIGGAVDLYYFLNHIKGVGFATMELLEPDGTGPLPNIHGTYELVAFTKEEHNSDEKNETAFNLMERQITGIFTTIGFYSRQAILNPADTCEIPNKGKENTCLVFDLYEPENRKFKIGDRNHHLLLCMQIFRSEMEYARANGSDQLFAKLKQAGHYPYSDMNRKAVV